MVDLDTILQNLGPRRERAIVDVGSGDMILPILGGPFDGNYLAWHPKDGTVRRFPPYGDWTRGSYHVSPRSNGCHVWVWQAT